MKPNKKKMKRKTALLPFFNVLISSRLNRMCLFNRFTITDKLYPKIRTSFLVQLFKGFTRLPWQIVLFKNKSTDDSSLWFWKQARLKYWPSLIITTVVYVLHALCRKNFLFHLGCWLFMNINHLKIVSYT